MVGVILAAGRGTRLLPITKWINKCLFPLGNKPVIYYPLSTLVLSGLKKIVVVIDPLQGYQIREYIQLIKKEFLFGVSIFFTVQPKPLGMPDAISTTANIVKGENIMVVGGDNIFGGSYEKYIKSFKGGDLSFLRRVPNPSGCAVPKYDLKGKLVDIVEKPKRYRGKWAITGPHIFDRNVFEIIKTLRPSTRGELAIVDIHKKYLNQNKLKLKQAVDFWADLGTFESLAKINYDYF